MHLRLETRHNLHPNFETFIRPQQGCRNGKKTGIRLLAMVPVASTCTPRSVLDEVGDGLFAELDFVQEAGPHTCPVARGLSIT